MTKSLNDQYQEVEDALDDAETLLDVDAIFEQLKRMPARTVQFVVNKLEAEFNKSFIDDAPDAEERSEIFAEARQQEGNQRSIEEVQTGMQVILNIAKIQGNNSGPIVKGIVEEMKKLSSEEYNSLVSLTQVMFNVLDQVTTKPALKTNPFAGLDKPKL